MMYSPSPEWARLNKRLSFNRIIKRSLALQKKIEYLNRIKTHTCVNYENLVSHKRNHETDTFFVIFPKYFSTLKRKQFLLKSKQ